MVNLAEKLGCTNEEPAIFEQITKLVGVEDQNRELQKTITKMQAELVEAKKNGQVIVKEACHSRICAFLARLGL